MESIAQTLLAGINDHSVHPEDKGDSGDLSTALVAASLQSNNSKLHGLVKTYLGKVGTKEAIKLIEVLMEYATSDPSMDRFEYDIEDQISNNTKVGMCACMFCLKLRIESSPVYSVYSWIVLHMAP